MTDWSSTHKVKVRVISQKGHCEGGHKVGEEWVIMPGSKTPEGICHDAFYVIGPYIQLMMYGGAFPWEPDPDKAFATCPDRNNPVVFEVRRLRE